LDSREATQPFELKRYWTFNCAVAVLFAKPLTVPVTVKVVFPFLALLVRTTLNVPGVPTEAVEVTLGVSPVAPPVTFKATLEVKFPTGLTVTV
jgi:hypothetical protein